MRFLERLGERYTASRQVLSNLRVAMRKANISLDLDDTAENEHALLASNPFEPRSEPDIVQEQLAQDGLQFTLMQSFQNILDDPLLMGDPAAPVNGQIPSPLHCEPLFHQMSNFLTLEPDFLGPFSPSYLGPIEEEASNPLLGRSQDLGQDDFLSFLVHDQSGWTDPGSLHIT